MKYSCNFEIWNVYIFAHTNNYRILKCFIFYSSMKHTLGFMVIELLCCDAASVSNSSKALNNHSFIWWRCNLKQFLLTFLTSLHNHMNHKRFNFLFFFLFTFVSCVFSPSSYLSSNHDDDDDVVVVVKLLIYIAFFPLSLLLRLVSIYKNEYRVEKLS